MSKVNTNIRLWSQNLKRCQSSTVTMVSHLDTVYLLSRHTEPCKLPILRRWRTLLQGNRSSDQILMGHIHCFLRFIFSWINDYQCCLSLLVSKSDNPMKEITTLHCWAIILRGTSVSTWRHTFSLLPIEKEKQIFETAFVLCLLLLLFLYPSFFLSFPLFQPCFLSSLISDSCFPGWLWIGSTPKANLDSPTSTYNSF